MNVISNIQIVWALVGLFFGLLLLAPQTWFPTRTKLTQFMCVQMLIASLFGMMGNQAWSIFFAAISVAVMLVMLIRAMHLSIPSIEPSRKHFHHITKDKHS